jgi:hypothetical protein
MSKVTARVSELMPFEVNVTVNTGGIMERVGLTVF